MKPSGSSASYPNQGNATPSAGTDDAALIARMSAGDEGALGLLYDRWEDSVRSLALAIVGESAEAEDVVEDVFWQAWRQTARFDASRGSAGAWLLTMTRSRSIDRVRAIRRTREVVGLDELEQSGSDPAIWTADDPLADAVHGERCRLVRAALRALPGEQRESLELAYFEGLSQTEIAERTGHPLGTVKTRMRLAMQKLRDSLAVLGERAT
jgi:RNA polymerase sigma-70 factor (ECF subfamily)